MLGKIFGALAAGLVTLTANAFWGSAAVAQVAAEQLREFGIAIPKEMEARLSEKVEAPLLSLFLHEPRPAPDSKTLQLTATLDGLPDILESNDLRLTLQTIDPWGIRPPREFEARLLSKDPRFKNLWIVEVAIDECESPEWAIWQTFVSGRLLTVARGVLWPGLPGGQLCNDRPRQPFMVNTDLDAPDTKPGDGVCRIRAQRNRCSLRAALEETNALQGPDTITFDVDYVKLDSRLGPLPLRDDVHVRGNGRSVTVIDASSGPATLFQDARISTPQRSYLFDSLTIRDGREAFDIYLNASLELRDVTVANLSQGLFVSDNSRVTLRRVAATGLGAGRIGGASMAPYLTPTLIEDSSFADGRNASVLLTSLFSDVQVLNTTIADNAFGTSVFFAVGNVAGAPTVSVRNGTIVKNTGLTQGVMMSGRLRLSNTLLANPDAPNPAQPGQMMASECAPPQASPTPRPTVWVLEGHSFIDNADACGLSPGTGDQIGRGQTIDPDLDPRQVNGGRMVYPLKAGSAARNAGSPATPDPALFETCLPFDQTGAARPVDGRCDIGATDQ